MALDSALNWLNGAQNPDGSWGYLKGQAGRVEPTLYASAAIGEAPLDWLRAHDLGWAVLLLPAALSELPRARALCRASLPAVLARRGEPAEASAGTYDPSLVGWAWYAGTFSWVTPTSWATLSLCRHGMADHPRIDEARRMLVDRQSQDGGWNVGNPNVLGAQLDGYLHTTSWAVMALQDADALDRAWPFYAHVLERPSTLNLALAILAHVSHGRDATPFVDALLARHARRGFGERVDTVSLAAIALRSVQTGRHPFLRTEVEPHADG